MRLPEGGTLCPHYPVCSRQKVLNQNASKLLSSETLGSTGPCLAQSKDTAIQPGWRSRSGPCYQPVTPASCLSQTDRMQNCGVTGSSCHFGQALLSQFSLPIQPNVQQGLGSCAASHITLGATDQMPAAGSKMELVAQFKQNSVSCSRANRTLKGN